MPLWGILWSMWRWSSSICSIRCIASDVFVDGVVRVCNYHKMDLYCCGFNGFNQIQTTTSKAQFTLFPRRRVTDISFSWSILIIFSENDIFISGLVGEITQLKKLVLPSENKGIQVSCSSNRALFVTDNGECWEFMYCNETWRKLPNFTSIESETAHEKTSKCNSLLQETDDQNELRLRPQITRVCCQDVVNIALDECGRVYSIPSLLSTPGIKVVDIACGFEHCIMLDDKGTVYTWGSGTRGQLGHGVLDVEESPCEVQALSGLRIIKIAAGGWHSAVITDSGDLYTWGWNNSGQLGFPTVEDSLSKKNKNTKQEEELKSNQMQCDNSYSKCINLEFDSIDEKHEKKTDENKAEKHLIVEEHSSAVKDNVVEVQNYKKVKLHNEDNCSVSFERVHVCTNTTVCQEDSKGDQICESKTGINKYNCESSKAVNVLAEPLPVDVPLGIDVNVVDVACGNRHTVMLLDDGSVWGCGRNTYGQLGLPGDIQTCCKLTKIPLPFDSDIKKVFGVRCGSWNTALLVDNKHS